MAHFAELRDNVIQRVIVVNNDVITDENGVEQEALGVAFLKGLFGEETEWVQTSYNANTRGKFASIGDRYDAATDTFVTPIKQPVATE